VNRRPRRCPGRFEPVHRQARINEVEDDHSGDLEASEGFAIVAYPATYRSSGVMTFIMNSDRIAYENDLGEQTATAERQISSVHSNDSWKKVE